MAIHRIEVVVREAVETQRYYEVLRVNLHGATPRITYAHTRCVCANCGNHCIDQGAFDENGRVRFFSASPPDHCMDCLNVLANYGHYDEWEEDEGMFQVFTCETCDGEYGDGWSTCTCDDGEANRLINYDAEEGYPE